MERGRKRRIVVALAGNPNSGKTTVFNNLTGARQHVGNWPGVTVERKEGTFEWKGLEVHVVDLPGTYGLTAFSLDEKIARDFIVKERPDVVVVVVDASNLERNLYLVTQILEAGANVVVCLNMMDLARARGIEVDVEGLSRALGVPVVPTVATKGEGIRALKDAIVEAAERGAGGRFGLDYGREIEPTIEAISEELASALPGGYSPRWVALRVLEGDPDVEALVSDRERLERARALVEELSRGLERVGLDPETALAERRYGYIHGLAAEFVRTRPGLAERIDWSDRIDKVVTHRLLGLPLFFGVMALTFMFVFALGGPLSDWIDALFGLLAEKAGAGLSSLGAPHWLASLVSDGLISGLGAVIVFVPPIALLFLAIAVLEDSGYMARAAFVMDRAMHALGLHGRSFIPLLLGFGCNVPGIMAARTLPSEKDRILTILVNPFMSCSARLPIYVLFTAVFFRGREWLVVFALYILGILVAIFSARLFKRLFFRGEVAPLIMELPPYRLPTLRSVAIHMWERTQHFLRKAGTFIVGTVVLAWLLASLPPGVKYASEGSLIGRLGGAIAPLLAPAGLGFWQAAVALFFGILAKEAVVGTLGTLFGVGEEGLKAVLPKFFTPLSATSFMVMSLLYIPCIASIATIRKEIGGRWAALAVGWSLFVGWALATLVYQVGRLLGLG